MRRFLLGFIAAVVIVLLAEFLWVRLGFVDPRADVPESVLERRVAMPSLDASLDRHAGEARNPVAATDASLLAGMKIYQTNCAGCHGDPHQPHGAFGGLILSACPSIHGGCARHAGEPEFLHHSARNTSQRNACVESSLSEQEIWQVTTFLSHIDKLSPELSEQWKAIASKTP